MSLSKSKEEYLNGKGWSSSLFFEKAKEMLTALEKHGCKLDFGRTVLHISKGNKKIKAYVHHNGRSREYLTFTDLNGEELETFHYTNDAEVIYSFIISEFS